MAIPGSQPSSIQWRAEVRRLFDLSRDLKARLEVIERKIADLKVEIAARQSKDQRSYEASQSDVDKAGVSGCHERAQA
jgi:hypothetical protein